jgi:hypothetical protein
MPNLKFWNPVKRKLETPVVVRVLTSQSRHGSVQVVIIGLIGIGSDSLLRAFDAAGIEYETRPPQPGVIMNSGDAVKIAEVAIPAVALVVSAWLHERSSRKAMLTMKDNKIEHLEGRTVEDIERLFKIAKKIMIMETKKPGSNPK